MKLQIIAASVLLISGVMATSALAQTGAGGTQSGTGSLEVRQDLAWVVGKQMLV